MEIKVFSQCFPPKPQSEDLDLQDLGVLDKTSLTSVVDFMHKFQEDATFAPPTMEVMYDSDKFDLNLDGDDEFPEKYIEVEDLDIEKEK